MRGDGRGGRRRKRCVYCGYFVTPNFRIVHNKTREKIKRNRIRIADERTRIRRFSVFQRNFLSLPTSMKCITRDGRSVTGSRSRTRAGTASALCRRVLIAALSKRSRLLCALESNTLLLICANTTEKKKRDIEMDKASRSVRLDSFVQSILNNSYA